MPELRCPECGNELLPSKLQDAVDSCVCQKCGRNVYSWSKAEVTIKSLSVNNHDFIQDNHRCGQHIERNVR